MAVFERDGIWICRHRKSFEDATLTEDRFGRGPEAEAAARALDEQWKNYMRDMRAFLANQSVRTNVVTFGALVEEYLAHCSVNARSENHIYSLKTVANGVFIPAFGEYTPITEIDYSKHILPLMEKIRRTPTPRGTMRTPCTINKYGNYLQMFFNYAVMRKYIDESPMKPWHKQRVPRKQILLSREDLEKIKDNAPPHLQWAIEVAYNLGVRTGPSELFALKWSDIDYEKRRVHVYARKTKTERYVPVCDEFLERLRYMQSQARCDYIVSCRGRQVKSLRKSFRESCARAGITYEVEMYDIRHRHASDLLNAGAPMVAVSRSLGHSRTSTTFDQYYECLPEDMDLVAAKLPRLRSSALQPFPDYSGQQKIAPASNG